MYASVLRCGSEGNQEWWWQEDVVELVGEGDSRRLTEEMTCIWAWGSGAGIDRRCKTT